MVSRAGREVLAAVLGDGEGRSRRSLEALLERHRPGRALLIGVAGGLSPDLQIGDPGARGDRLGRSWRVGQSESGGDGRIVSAPRIVATRSEKAALWKENGEAPRSVVDLESAGFVSVLEGRDVAWAVCRAVSDTAEEELPNELVAASDDGGHISRFAVLRRLLANPGRLSTLMGLRGAGRGVCAAACRGGAGLARRGPLSRFQADHLL